MLAELRTGLVTAQDGAVQPGRAGKYGEIITGETVGKYFEMARQGRLFMASSSQGAALGTALTATNVTLAIYNPLGSGVYASILQGVVQPATNQITTVNIQQLQWAVYGPSSQTAPTSLTEAVLANPGILVGGAAASLGMVRAYTASTWAAAPKLLRPFPFAISSFTTQAYGMQAGMIDMVEGMIVVPPGVGLTIQGFATTTGITGQVYMSWVEVII